MAIASKRLDSRMPKEIPVVEEIQERRDSTLTALVPESRVDTLLKYVEGYPWKVTYFGQLLNTNSTVDHFDIKQGDFSQSYVEIKDLVLKVQSPLGFDYDEEQGETVLTGDSVMPFKVTPNPGDVFIGNVDSGEDVIFSVNSVKRLSHRKDSLYSISYTSLVYINDDKEFIERLKKRVNETYYYDNYRDSKNSNVLISTTEKFHIDKLRAFLYDSQEHYFRLFNQRESASLAVPGCDFILFDQVLNEFIQKTVEVSKYDTYRTHGYTNYNNGYNRDNILDCLIKRVDPTTRRIEREYGFYPTSIFFKRGQLHAPYYSHVDYLLAPIDWDDSMISKKPKMLFEKDIIVFDPRNSHNYDRDVNVYVTVKGKDGDVTMPVLPTLFDEWSYIVSAQFYDYLKGDCGAEGISLFEVVLARYFKTGTVSNEDVFKCLTEWESWSHLHQFYILPVIWFLAKQSLGVL